MHRLSAGFVLGYHGCDEETARKLIDGEPFRPSRNEYDWLGDGAYFWEMNPLRGLEFAKEVKRRGGAIAAPAVVGAVIDLRLCLDLASSSGIREVRSAFQSFSEMVTAAEAPMPRNQGGQDLLKRFLDRAVMEHLHLIRTKEGLEPIDTVRGLFVEGDRLYTDAGFFEKSHVQICVRNLHCIHGAFRVPDADLTEG